MLNPISRTYLLDSEFESLRDIASFIKEKEAIEDLTHKIYKKNLEEIKDVLSKTGLFKLGELIKVAKKINSSASSEEIISILFQECYAKNYDELLKQHTVKLNEIGKNIASVESLSIQDKNTLNKINQLFVSYIEEKNKGFFEKYLEELFHEYISLNPEVDASTVKDNITHFLSSIRKEKTLDELCLEFASQNPGANIQNLKSQMIHIRLLIEDLKNGKTLSHDFSEKIPISLIAEICVKMESFFHDKLRDSQLLALLSMLDSPNQYGTLAEVKTGEGKSYIIAALAIIQIKKGHEVDIITSSSTLAKRDLKKFQEFYQKEFGIHSDHNCEISKGMMAKSCYQKNCIVYGTSASFEGDNLRADFFRAKIFNGRDRKKSIAIIDEADSALLDKLTWLCQISDSVAGMSTVKPLLYYIWILVSKKIQEIADKKFESLNEYETFLKEIREQVSKDTEEFFSGKHHFLIPEHLKEFIQYRIRYWIDSSINAYCYSHNREYHACSVLKKITPIDFANTGEWEEDVQWEDGLHQFLQMKSGIGVETETLTKCFMSNFTLFTNRYASIYGLSGTLGEKNEAKIFQELFGLATLKIPSFRKNNFQEKAPWISATKEEWLDSLYGDVMNDGLKDEPPQKDQLPPSHQERNRATLIICQSIVDVEKIKKHFLNKGVSPSHIVTYTKGEEDKEKIRDATKAKIIIATNLSGRGTDIDASSIEENGGMHVIFSFLPLNKRIQDQGFGRTARKGLSGTGRLIIQTEEIESCHFVQEELSEGAPILTYDSIMEGQNQKEKNRLNHLFLEEKKCLIEKQQLFEEFKHLILHIHTEWKVSENLKKIEKNVLEIYTSYVLDTWAFFLDKVSKNLNQAEISHFHYEKNLEGMINKNDLYKMLYINATLDLDDPQILKAADAYYENRGEKIDLTAGFAWYNRTFIALKLDPSEIGIAKSYLNRAKKIFEEGEIFEKGLLKIQYELSPSEPKNSTQKTMEGTPTLRLILTMKALVEKNLEELDQLEKDNDKITVSFDNPYDLKEKPGDPNENKSENDEKGYTIPDDLMDEAIKLGLKGPLKLEGKGDLWKAILLAVACVIVAIAAIAAIALSGSTAAPLVAMLGGKFIFSIVTGGVLGAAFGGAVNAIKGAIKGDFSLNRFGKDVLIGAVTGAIGGGIGAGLTGLASPVLQTASVLTRVGINGGIGAVAGVGAAIPSYFINSAFQGKEITGEDFGKAVLSALLGGALGGGAAGLAPHLQTSLVSAIFSGKLGALCGNSAIQGVQLAMGDREKFDGFELLENILNHAARAGLMTFARNYAANQAKLNHKIVPLITKVNKEGSTQGKLAKLENVVNRGGTGPERERALKLLNQQLEKQGLPPKKIEDFDDEIQANVRQLEKNQNAFSRLSQSSGNQNQSYKNEPVRSNQKFPVTDKKPILSNITKETPSSKIEVDRNPKSQPSSLTIRGPNYQSLFKKDLEKWDKIAPNHIRAEKLDDRRVVMELKEDEISWQLHPKAISHKINGNVVRAECNLIPKNPDSSEYYFEIQAVNKGASGDCTLPMTRIALALLLKGKELLPNGASIIGVKAKNVMDETVSGEVLQALKNSLTGTKYQEEMEKFTLTPRIPRMMAEISNIIQEASLNSFITSVEEKDIYFTFKFPLRNLKLIHKKVLRS